MNTSQLLDHLVAFIADERIKIDATLKKTAEIVEGNWFNPDAFLLFSCVVALFFVIVIKDWLSERAKEVAGDRN